MWLWWRTSSLTPVPGNYAGQALAFRVRVTGALAKCVVHAQTPIAAIRWNIFLPGAVSTTRLSIFFIFLFSNIGLTWKMTQAYY